MKQATEMHQIGALSDRDVKRIMAEQYEYGAEQPNRRQRKARAAAMRKAK